LSRCESALHPFSRRASSTWNSNDRNISDFPNTALKKYRISAITPAELLINLLKENADEVGLVLQETRLSLKNPPKTVKESLETLRNQGLGRFSDQISARVEEL